MTHCSFNTHSTNCICPKGKKKQVFIGLGMQLFCLYACKLSCFSFFFFLLLRSLRTLRSKKQHATSGSLSLSLSQAATPTKTLCFSAASTPLHNNNNSSSSKGLLQESSMQCDGAHQLSSIQEQPHLRQRTVTTTTTTTLVDGRWGQ